MDGGALIDTASFVVREITLFAAAGFLLLGVGDLLVDLIWLVLRFRSMARSPGPPSPGEAASLLDLKAPARPGRLAVFIPAWDEAAVIGPMLRHALRVLDHPDYRLYVGCYPNDPDTIAAVRQVADARVRLVVGATSGPTTKADCLNTLWSALAIDEAASGRRVKAVVLHDAEDVVHSAELRLFDVLVERADLVQLPVLPLIDRRSRWVGASYADEFAEAHGKEMVVRQALGAGVPSAGVGCAIAREALVALAGEGGRPFDPASLTEDYELGLRLKAMGRRGMFVRLPPAPGRPVICTRAHFPGTLRCAVAQKSRWMTGIALAGWDRLGWSGGLAERWMRLRDRRSMLAAILLCACYLALLLTAPLASLAWLIDHPVALSTRPLAAMTIAATALLAWRLLVRFAFVMHSYGWWEGLRSVPRVVVGNAIAMLAARAAIGRYLRERRTGEAVWGKTTHIFPSELPAE